MQHRPNQLAETRLARPLRLAVVTLAAIWLSSPPPIAAQSADAVADRRCREVQPRRGAANVAFLEDGFEQHEQIEVDSG